MRVANSNQETQSISIGTHNEMFFVAAMQLLFIDCSRRFAKQILLSHAQIIALPKWLAILRCFHSDGLCAPGN
jgi:hypothetical protein